VTQKTFTIESLQWLLVYLLVLSTPFTIYPIIATSTRGLKPFQFFAILIILVGFVRLCGGAAVKLNAVTKSILFFCGVALLSLVGFAVSDGTWSNLTDYSSTAIQLFIVAGLVFSVSSLRADRKHLRRLLYVILIISVVISAYAIYQSLARMYGLPFAYLEIYNPSLTGRGGQGGGAQGPFVRPSAFFTEPSRLGQFLLTPTLLSLFLYISAPKQWNQAFLLIALVFTVAGFLLAFSMGAYIAMGGAIAAAFFINEVRTYALRVVLISVGTLFVLSLILYPVLEVPFWEIMWSRAVLHLQTFGTESVQPESIAVSTSVSARLAKAQEGLHVWLNHPFLGVGVNNFERFYSQGAGSGLHSALLQSLAEMGILGGVAFLTLAFGTPVSLLRKWRSVVSWERVLYIALGLGLLGRAVWMILAGNYVLDFFWLDMMVATILLSYNPS
jgi:hypothetical protein